GSFFQLHIIRTLNTLIKILNSLSIMSKSLFYFSSCVVYGIILKSQLNCFVQNFFCLLRILIIGKCNSMISVILHMIATHFKKFIKGLYCILIFSVFKVTFRFQIIQICHSCLIKINIFILFHIICHKRNTLLISLLLKKG